MTKHAVIVGGGISGLATAFFLSRRAFLERFPLKITVLESSGRFGGVIQTLRNRHLCVEAAADAFEGKDPVTLELCETLGLREELAECEPTFGKVRIAHGTELVPLDLSSPDPWAALMGPGLDLWARARLLLEPMIPAVKIVRDESVANFIRRRLGKALLEQWAEPVARGIFMTNSRQLSMQAYFPHWQAMERKYGSMAKALLDKRSPRGFTHGFFSIKGGMDRLTDALLKKTSSSVFKLRHRVLSLKHGEKWEIFLGDGRKIGADSVCLALPAPESGELLKNMAPLMAKELGTIRYASLAVVNLVFRPENLPWKLLRPGFIVPSRKKRWPFDSLKVIGRTENKKFIKLRAFLSAMFHPDLWAEGDHWVEQEVLRCLAWELQAEIRPEWIATLRYPQGLALYGVEHAERVSAIERMIAQHRGLYVTGNGFRGFGITECVCAAQNTAQKIFLYLKGAARHAV